MSLASSLQTDPNTNRYPQYANHKIISLGWIADGENDFDVLPFSLSALEREILIRHRTERFWLSRAIESATATAFHATASKDRNFAMLAAENEVLARGLGVSYWVLDQSGFQAWKRIWDQRAELICHEIKAGTNKKISSAIHALEEQFWAIFSLPPAAAVSVSQEHFAQTDANQLAKSAFHSILKSLSAF